EQNGQKLLSEMITYLGAIRTDIYYSIYTHQDQAESAAGVMNMFNTYKTYEKEFFIKSSPAAVEEYKKLKQEAELKMIFDQLSRVANTWILDTSYDAEGWLRASAKGIDKLKEVQRKLVSRIESGVKNVYEKERTDKDRNLIALAAVIALVVFIIF